MLLIVWIIATFLSFVTQCSLILIFLEIGKKNPLRRDEGERVTMFTADRTTSYKTFKMTFKESAESALKYSKDDTSRDTAVNELEELDYRDKTTPEDDGLTGEMRLTMQVHENLHDVMQDEVLTNIVQ